MTTPSSPYDDAATCTACGSRVLFFPKYLRYIDASGSDFCGIAYDGHHTRAVPVVTVPTVRLAGAPVAPVSVESATRFVQVEPPT